MMGSWQANLLKGCSSAHGVTRVRFLIICSNQGMEEKPVHQSASSSTVRKLCSLLWKEDSRYCSYQSLDPQPSRLNQKIMKSTKWHWTQKNDHFSSKFSGVTTLTFTIHAPSSTLFSLLMTQSWLQMQQNLSATAGCPKASLAYYSSCIDEGH